MTSTEQDSPDNPGADRGASSSGADKPTARLPLMAFSWLWVGVPFLYGVYALLVKIPALFTS